jgi:XTP/dITP diphosphohydrolase
VTRWVLATGNAGKQRELQALLAPLGHAVVMQSTLGVVPVDETGSTFHENALLKARHAARHTGLPALADDSGLEVDALGGAPGVRSARFAGEQATDAQNLTLLLQQLRAVPAAGRGARFRCVVAWVSAADDPAPRFAEGCWEGRILEQARGAGGFGYDPVFLPTGSSLTVAELDEAEKNRASHRGQALRALLAQWEQGR